MRATLIGGVMLLACDPAVTGVNEEDAAMARDAVAAADAAMKKEAEEKAAAEKTKKDAKVGLVQVELS